MVLVYIEVRDGKIKKSSLEVLSEGKRRGEDLSLETAAVLVGAGLDGLAAEAGRYGADKVYVLNNPELTAYTPSGYTAALAELAAEIKPEIILFAAGSMGKDLAPRLAAKVGVSLASDCVRTEVNEGRLEVIRPLFAGKALATFRFNAATCIASLRPNVFPLAEPTGEAGEIIKKDVTIPDELRGDQVSEILREEGDELDVSEADIVVAGGRGMKGLEHFALLKELAAILPHAAVGASRAAVDSDWIDHQNQVGQTGKTISPDLYVAAGISGAIQHLAGMSSSKFIVAVNKDPEAPIFKIADFGIVGDLFELLPFIKKEVQSVLAE